MVRATDCSGNVPSSTNTTLTFLTTSVDTAGAFNGTTFTVPVGYSGYYQVGATVQLNGSGGWGNGTSSYLGYTINNSTTPVLNAIYQVVSHSFNVSYTGSDAVPQLLQEGDTISFFLNQASGGGTKSIVSNAAFNHCYIIRVS